MLRAILNKSWQQYPAKEELYVNIPKLSSVIEKRRIRTAGHCWRSKTELVSNLLPWIPKHVHTQVARQCKTYINQLALDNGNANQWSEKCHGRSERLEKNNKSTWLGQLVRSDKIRKVLINQTELVFASYKNQKEKNCLTYLNETLILSLKKTFDCVITKYSSSQQVYIHFSLLLNC